MSREYPCVYYDHEKCTLHGTEPDYIDWCVMGPCSKETPSNADHIRSMTDEELAKWLDEDLSCCCYCSEDARLENEPLLHGEKCDEQCKKHLLDWLKQPYGGDA